MNDITVFLTLITIIIYFTFLFGIIYLSYLYIKYINKLEKEKCGCSEDIKRNIIKNFSYLILISWILFIIFFFICPINNIKKIMYSKIFNLINLIIIGIYGWILFSYSKKLIDESCKCSDDWLRDAMQYQSYIYIFISLSSFILFLVRILLGDDKKEIFKIINGLK